MEETPESPLPAGDAPPPEGPGTYGVSDRLIAVAGLLATAFLSYVFADVIVNGRLTQVLSPAAPPEATP